MTRTEELKLQGAEMRGDTGGGDNPPFVKWPDEGYAFIEGVVKDVWEGPYSLNVVLEVSDASDNLEVERTMNLGLVHAALKGSITPEDVEKEFHIAFEGWGTGKASGNKFRSFTVLEMGSRKNGGETPTNLDSGSVEKDGLPHTGGGEVKDAELRF